MKKMTQKIDEKELQHEKRETLNNAVAKLTEGRYSPIASTLNTSWDDVSMTQQKYYQRKMKEVIQTALSVVVPGQKEQNYCGVVCGKKGSLQIWMRNHLPNENG